ncbi:hypothetical protein D6745_03295 [Candidatus Woesearchaeota archaeon]|nr:MAG: hypothetical protein D6745_03295 [Candidatus Woesearchaeota archaeon]
MVCYILPTIAAITTYSIRKKTRNSGKYSLWLNQMFLGGAVFGIVDHAINGQLLFSGNLAFDLMLGSIITIAIFIVWQIIVQLDRTTMKNKAVNASP